MVNIVKFWGFFLDESVNQTDNNEICWCKKKLQCKNLPLVFLKILDKNPDDCCSSELRGPNVVSLVGKGSHCDMLLNKP